MSRFGRPIFLPLVLGFGVLIGAYALVGFKFAPGWIRRAVIDQVREQIGAKATVGRIVLNPFSLRAEVDDLSLAVPGGEPLVGFGHLVVSVRFASLWHRALSFDEIEIDGAFANLVVAADGTVNLARLQPKLKAPTESGDKPLPRVDIGIFKVSRGFLTYEDRSRPTAFATRLDPIEFELRDFSTGAAGGAFTFSGATKLGERIEWRGHLSAQPIASDGDLRVESLQAHTLWAYAEDRLAFEVNSGSLDLALRYHFSLGPAPSLRTDLSTFTVKELAIRRKGADTDWIVVPRLAVGPATLDLAAHKVDVDSVLITEPKLLAWLMPDRTINLMQLAGWPAAAVPSPGSPASRTSGPTLPAAAAPRVVARLPAAPVWQVTLQQLKIERASVSFEDRSVRPTAAFLFAPLDVTVTGVSEDLGKAVNFQVASTLGGDAAVQLKGAVTLEPLAASVDVKVANLNLASFQPYLLTTTSMTLLSGRLNADSELRYGGKPALRLLGRASITDLHTVDNDLNDDFVNWKRLDLEGLAYQQGPTKLEIAKVVAVEPYARVIIEPDSRLNLKRILAGPGTLSVSSPPVTAAASSQSPTGSAVPAPAAMPITIRSVEFASGQVDFSDLSIDPSFSAGIQQFAGSVRGLSSDPASRAVVDLHGQVAAFSPVSISGQVNLLSPVLYTDLGMRFSNIALSIFNPYSGKFAGYNITEGKLTTELDYKIDGRKLDARHHLVIDQLEFGGATDSKDAVALPVKLAVALLKDRNGVIDLDLPVDGSLDDPDFHLGPALRKVCADLLLKVVSAPFALIGRLFGGGPDLQFVDFRPGDATLDGAALVKIKALTQALLERPQLKLTVPIGVVPELDRPALAAARLAADLDAAARSNARATAFDALPAAARLTVLTDRYRAEFGAPPVFPDADPGPPPTVDRLQSRIDFLSAQLQARINVDDAALLNLGQQRALALQAALLAESRVDPGRVFLAASDKSKPENNRARLELALQ